MRLICPAFSENGRIPSKFTCEGENVNPELRFLEVPSETQSLTIICHDPDAPKEGGWTHWIVINIAPDSHGIAEASGPTSGLETMTDFGRPGYGGPCPPSGEHRYYFYLYALNTTLTLDARATKAQVEAAMQGHLIEKAHYMGVYQKQS